MRVINYHSFIHHTNTTQTSRSEPHTTHASHNKLTATVSGYQTYLWVKIIEVEELELEHDEVVLQDTLLHQ